MSAFYYGLSSEQQPTAISNIHFGLSAWSNATYAVGNRRSNGGHAYQCITAGTSTVAPSGTGSSINNGGVSVWKWLSAIDYTSVSAWATAIPTVLTQPVVGLLWNNAAITTTAGVAYLNLTGKTTTTINTITLKCADGESFRDTLSGQITALAYSQTNGVAFLLPSGTGSINYFTIDTSNTFIEGIQFKDPQSTSNCAIMAFGARGNIEVRDCIFDGFGQASGSSIIGYTGAGTGIDILNCLIIDRAASPGTGCATVILFSNPCNVINCTIIGINSPTASHGIETQTTSGNMAVRNCIVIGYAAANAVYCSTTGGAAVDHSLFTNASLTATNVKTGTNNLFSKTAANQFISSTTDFRLLSTADAKDAGITDSVDISAADDISGTVRAKSLVWDIGCWEYVANIITLTTTGTSTWNLPADCVAGTPLIIETWGGGSGASGRVGTTFGASGGGGAYARSIYYVGLNDLSNGVSYTIGTGSAGTSGANPSAGGDTSWSTSSINLITNSTMIGASATPSTLPTNWSIISGAGLTTQVMEVGTESVFGLRYIDLRIYGEATGTAISVMLDPYRPCGVLQYTASFYLSVVNGSTAHISNIYIAADTNANAGGNPGAFVNTPIFAAVSPTNTLTRFTGTGTAGATSAFISEYLNVQYPANSIIDCTFRIAGIQIEQAAAATFFKPTPGYTLAKGGGAPSALVAGAGGASAASVGSVITYSGGAGVAYSTSGAGGGGAAGKDGVGGAGVVGAGGTGDNTLGGAGGAVKTTNPGNAGTANSEGGGGGGSLTTVAGTGGAGGLPGGGGGAAVVATGTGGSGAGGQIRITYTPLVSSSVLIAGTTWVPPTNCPIGTLVAAETWGAGSGGTGRVGTTFGAAGGGGAYSKNKYILRKADIDSGLSYIIGAGSSGTSGAASSAGADTIFSRNTGNLVADTRMSAAVAGTPGTLPTNWAYENQGTLSTSIIGTGLTAEGFEYCDFRIFGTASTPAFQFFPAGYFQPTVMPNITAGNVTISIYHALVAGSLSNINVVLWQVDEMLANSSVHVTTGPYFTPTATLTRATFTTTMAFGGDQVMPNFALYFTSSSGSVVDFTLRFAGMQVEQSSLVTYFKSRPGHNLASGGGAATSATIAGAGGSATTSIGTTKFGGGAGAAYNAAGSGGGGSAGEDGIGGAGTTAGLGGTGDNTKGGSGGAVKATNPGNAGTSNTEGGGGGGGLITVAGTGGAGGLPGGGGGGAAVATGTGGAGGRGQIRLTYPYSTPYINRATRATYFDATGTLQTADINEPRYSYDPATLAYAGKLVEEASANLVTNPRCEGAVAGTPGTLPTNWLMTVNGANISTSVIGTGVENGIDYIDIRVFGTASGNLSSPIQINFTTRIESVSGDTIATSFYTKLAGGSLGTGQGLFVEFTTLTSGFVAIAKYTSTFGGIIPTSAGLATQRSSYTVSHNDSTSAYGQIFLTFESGSTNTVDATFRIGGLQIEKRSSVTSLILPPVGNIPALYGSTLRSSELPVDFVRRASTATYFDSNGLLREAEINEARYTYDPIALDYLGPLNETDSANWIPNPRGEGLVAGTPGTQPTNWNIVFGAYPSTTYQMVGSGIESGINYVDINMSGTASAFAGIAQIFFLPGNGVPTVVGDVWTWSFYLRSSAGTIGTIYGLHEIQTLDINGTNLGEYSESSSPNFIYPTTAGLSTQRSSYTMTVADANAASIRFGLILDVGSSGGAYNITVRIGGLQAEKRSSVSSLILPPAGTPASSGSSTTRAADVTTTISDYATLISALTPISLTSVSTVSIGASLSPAIWNSADKSTDIALSDNNTTATDTSGVSWNTVRATGPKSSGKYYIEAIIKSI